MILNPGMDISCGPTIEMVQPTLFLGRFLVHNTLLDGKSIISLKKLLKITFDHHPISLLFEKKKDIGTIPFRVSPLWTGRDGFMDIIYQGWSKYVDGSPSFIWE